MDNFLAGVKQAAGEFAGGEQQPQVPGQPVPGTAAGAETPASNLPEAGAAAGGAGHAGGSSTDWSNLSKLAGMFGSAEEKHGSGFDASTFASFLGSKWGAGDAATPGQAAQQAGADPGVVDKLLNFYHQQTGKTFEPGGGGSFAQLQQMAAKQLGIDVPQPILEKLIKWKLQSLI